MLSSLPLFMLLSFIPDGVGGLCEASVQKKMRGPRRVLEGLRRGECGIRVWENPIIHALM